MNKLKMIIAAAAFLVNFIAGGNPPSTPTSGRLIEMAMMEYRFEGGRITLPVALEAFDFSKVSKGNIREFERKIGGDPELKKMVTEAVEGGVIKFVAVDKSARRRGEMATINVVVVPRDGAEREEIVQGNLEFMQQSGYVLADLGEVRAGGHVFDRIRSELLVTGKKVKMLSYILIHKEQVHVVTFAGVGKSSEKFLETAEDIIRTYRPE